MRAVSTLMGAAECGDAGNGLGEDQGLMGGLGHSQVAQGIQGAHLCGGGWEADSQLRYVENLWSKPRETPPPSPPHLRLITPPPECLQQGRHCSSRTQCRLTSWDTAQVLEHSRSGLLNAGVPVPQAGHQGLQGG